MHKILILGSTGSIGTQSLEVIDKHPDKLSVFGLSAHSNWELLADQVNTYRPKFAVLTNATNLSEFKSALKHHDTEILVGSEHLEQLVKSPEIDTVLNSLVGFAGFIPTYNALRAGKRVALANKESLVVGGELLKNFLGFEQPQLFPIDSEHSAILQCLVGEPAESIEKLIITASGGPFRNHTIEELAKVTVASALAHPNWSMGAKITIDSSTLMNKGLEVMEAYWLFALPLSKIEAVIHPQSIIHSMVTFVDGSTKAQLGVPDMKVPIQYALTFPDRWAFDAPRINWKEAQNWTFQPIDHAKFPCFGLAMDALEAGGYAPAVLNASNEIAVERFLNREIPYIAISEIVRKSLEKIENGAPLSAASIVETDLETRKFAKTLNL